MFCGFDMPVLDIPNYIHGMVSMTGFLFFKICLTSKGADSTSSREPMFTQNTVVIDFIPAFA